MFKIYKISKVIAPIAIAGIVVAPLWASNNVYINTAKAAQVSYYESRFYIKVRQNMFKRQLQMNKLDEIEEAVDETENIIIEETYYIDLDVPSEKPFKSYMDARMITSTNSAQYKLKSEYELDDSGIYMVDGRYACAIGSYYSTEIGTYFDIVMTSGEVIPCILADCKADEHTDNLGQYTLGNGSIVEFVVNEPTLIPNISNQWGNTGDVSTLGGIFEGEIAYIRMYFD